MNDTYTDLLLHIFPKTPAKEPITGDYYPVEAVIDGRMTFRGKLNPDLASLLRYEHMEKLGEKLSGALFGENDSLLLALGRARGLAANMEGRLRVRLQIDDPDDDTASDLHALAWERLYDPESAEARPFAVAIQTPFSRYVALPDAEPPLANPPLRLLFVVSNPAGLPDDKTLNVKAEIENLREALGDLKDLGNLEVRILAGHSGTDDPSIAEILSNLRAMGYDTIAGRTSLTKLAEEMRDWKPHVLHFLGHGNFDGQQGVLWFEKEDGSLDTAITDQVFARRLSALYPQPQLVFLAACESATMISRDPSAGLASRLIKVGIPAVVAMRTKVGMKVARDLTRVFYRQLVLHGLVDRALNEARQRVWRDGSADASIPILFMRLQTGKLAAPDPVVQSLIAIRHDPKLEASGYNFPLEVIHLASGQDSYSPDLIEPEATATQTLIEALEQACNSQPVDDKPALIVLLGVPGSGKSFQIKRFLRQTTERQIRRSKAEQEEPSNVDSVPHTSRRIIPLYVDLRAYDYRVSGDSLEEMIFQSLSSYWPDPAPKTFEALHTGVTLRVILDNCDDLGEALRHQVFEELAQLISRKDDQQGFMLKQHRFILTSNPHLFERKPFVHKEIALQQLIIQPLSQRRIRHFLENDKQEASKELLNWLNERQVFDVASSPQALALLMQHARGKDLPSSRVEVVERLIEDGIANVSAQQGLRSLAATTLDALAWRMQRSGRAVLPLSEAFEIMAEVRGSRGYQLEEMFSELVDKAKLLSRVGETALRFGSGSVQSHCCARAIVAMEEARREQILGDIVAALDQPPRVRWWADTVVYVCGMLWESKQVIDREALNKLIPSLIYGDNLLTGERVFIAARCLIEAPGSDDDALGPETILRRRQVMDALHWRSLAEHESSLGKRLEAIRLLGQVADEEYTLRICSLAFDSIRRDLRGRGEYEFGAIRTTAVTALARLAKDEQGSARLRGALEKIGSLATGLSIGPDLVRLVHAWHEGQANEVESMMCASELSLPVRSAAALALGDTIARLEITEKRVDACQSYLQSLKETFLDPNSHETLRWAVTHGLALVNMPTADRPFIRQVVDLIDGPHADSGYAAQLRKCLAYLIGRIRALAPEAHDFLIEHCLDATCDGRVWGTAIEAMGWLANDGDRLRLELIAEGRYPKRGILLKQDMRPAEDDLDDVRDRVDKRSDGEAQEVDIVDYVRSKAIAALSSVGDLGTLTRLRNSQKYSRQWSTRLMETYYRTSEEIYWRLNDERVTGPAGAFTTAF